MIRTYLFIFSDTTDNLQISGRSLLDAIQSFQEFDAGHEWVQTENLIAVLEMPG